MVNGGFMIDPVIFSFTIGRITIAFRWYGLLVMAGVMVAAWLSANEVKRRGENPDHIWDALIWIVIAGVIGARLWYVASATLSGSRVYLENPLRILNITEGGLHFYGAVLFGGIALIIYAKVKKLDLWLLLDSLAPNILIGQAIARPANFINQELYGPPTTLPWGIKIDAAHRIPPYNDLILYPEKYTRFHPTFSYEMLWNLFAAFGLMLIARKFEEKIRPGVIFYGWMVLAGLGRIFIEFWRPDQPHILGTFVTYTMAVAALMVVAGLALLLDKLEVIRIPFIPRGEDEHHLAPREKDISADLAKFKIFTVHLIARCDFEASDFLSNCLLMSMLFLIPLKDHIYKLDRWWRRGASTHSFYHRKNHKGGAEAIYCLTPPL